MTEIHPLCAGLGIGFCNHAVCRVRSKLDDPLERGQGFGMPSACAMKKAANVNRPAVVRIETQRSLHGALCGGQFGGIGAVPSIQVVATSDIGAKCPNVGIFLVERIA